MPAAEPLQPPNTDHALFHQAPNNSGFLSQWYDGPDPDGHFTVDNRRYSSAEQAMIDFKALYFGDRTALGPIMATTDPTTIHTAVPGDGRRAPATMTSMALSMTKSARRCCVKSGSETAA